MVRKEEIEKLVKEKILLIGEAGTGKTYNAVRVAGYLSERGQKVTYIDPEFGAERELLRLTDAQLENIDLRVCPEWGQFKEAIRERTDCYIKIVDGLSEAIELFRRYLEAKFTAQGFYVVSDKEFEIKDPDTFLLPWASFPKVYDEMKYILYEMLQHDYQVLATMHPLRASDAKQELEQSIKRKFDTVIEMRRSEGDSVNWYAVVRKNRGREDAQMNINIKPESILSLFKRKFEGE